ncbi:hypothetical protein [Agarilytica rhodophyticola]|uniref:hypothetical protein n=1 Tax=Agarilytica rhodophyticola TaxID=1737490 RepID=UPI000B3429BE|nr:hypothetical protein [Agarilytica rhodophyticola]
MPVDKDPINNDLWANERKALKKIQMHFTFTAHASRLLKIDAVNERMSTTNYLRKLLGLTFAQDTRDRIGISLSEDDFAHLAQRYEVDVNDKDAIKRKVTASINLLYNNKDTSQEP